MPEVLSGAGCSVKWVNVEGEGESRRPNSSLPLDETDVAICMLRALDALGLS